MATRKASAIEQYDKELEELQKQKKEIMTTKTFEVQKQRQGQQQGQTGNQPKLRDLKPSQVKALLSKANSEGNTREADRIKKWLVDTKKPQGWLNTPDTTAPVTGGNRRHRFTVRQRQPRRFHGY
jgi:hypothetical protein